MSLGRLLAYADSSDSDSDEEQAVATTAQPAVVATPAAGSDDEGQAVKRAKLATQQASVDAEAAPPGPPLLLVPCATGVERAMARLLPAAAALLARGRDAEEARATPAGTPFWSWADAATARANARPVPVASAQASAVEAFSARPYATAVRQPWFRSRGQQQQQQQQQPPRKRPLAALVPCGGGGGAVGVGVSAADAAPCLSPPDAPAPASLLRLSAGDLFPELSRTARAAQQQLAVQQQQRLQQRRQQQQQQQQQEQPAPVAAVVAGGGAAADAAGVRKRRWAD